eukprot:snap_masked-scaffold_5-processed-gene-1.54-mRNA-1 protein AED:1.00 eAED:1.00 QI:0/-1/0/0/-1/1/1/0/670
MTTNNSIISKLFPQVEGIKKSTTPKRNKSATGRKLRSVVHEYFEADELTPRSYKCKACGRLVKESGDSQTSRRNQHIKRDSTHCFEILQKLYKNSNVPFVQSPKRQKLEKWIIPQAKQRSQVSSEHVVSVAMKYLIKSDLPISHASTKPFIEFVAVFSSGFKGIPAETAENIIRNMYEIKRNKLKEILFKHVKEEKVSLSLDDFSGSPKNTYILVRVQLINKSYRKKNYLLHVEKREKNWSALEFSTKLFGLLKEYNLIGHIFGITSTSSQDMRTIVQALRTNTTSYLENLAKADSKQVSNIDTDSYFACINEIVQNGIYDIMNPFKDYLHKIAHFVDCVASSQFDKVSFSPEMQEEVFREIKIAGMNHRTMKKWSATFESLISAKGKILRAQGTEVEVNRESPSTVFHVQDFFVIEFLLKLVGELEQLRDMCNSDQVLSVREGLLNFLLSSVGAIQTLFSREVEDSTTDWNLISMNNVRASQEAVEKLLTNLQQISNEEVENPVLHVAKLLDKRIAANKEDEMSDHQGALELLKKFVSQVSDTADAVSHLNLPKLVLNPLVHFMNTGKYPKEIQEVKEPVIQTSLADTVKNYLDAGSVSSGSVLDFWKHTEGKFLALAKVAKLVYSVPISTFTIKDELIPSENVTSFSDSIDSTSFLRLHLKTWTNELR